jgi:hypothetical protein
MIEQWGIGVLALEDLDLPNTPILQLFITFKRF